MQNSIIKILIFIYYYVNILLLLINYYLEFVMPNKKSAKKELRKNIKRNAANKRISGRLKTLVKANLKKIQANDKSVKDNLSQTIKAIDKATKKGIIKKNTASRKKSKLMKKINALK